MTATQTEAFQTLLLTFRLTETGFIVFAVYASDQDLNDVIQAFTEQADIKPLLVEVPQEPEILEDSEFMWGLRAIGTHQNATRAQLVDRATPRDRNLIFLKTKIDPQAQPEQMTRFCGFLNSRGHELISYPHGTIVWVTDEAMTAIAKAGPEGYHLNRGIFDFRTTPIASMQTLPKYRASLP